MNIHIKRLALTGASLLVALGIGAGLKSSRANASMIYEDQYPSHFNRLIPGGRANHNFYKYGYLFHAKRVMGSPGAITGIDNDYHVSKGQVERALEGKRIFKHHRARYHRIRRYHTKRVHQVGKYDRSVGKSKFRRGTYYDAAIKSGFDNLGINQYHQISIFSRYAPNSRKAIVPMSRKATQNDCFWITGNKPKNGRHINLNSPYYNVYMYYDNQWIEIHVSRKIANIY